MDLTFGSVMLDITIVYGDTIPLAVSTLLVLSRAKVILVFAPLVEEFRLLIGRDGVLNACLGVSH
jgi:hypothetical protein